MTDHDEGIIDLFRDGFQHLPVETLMQSVPWPLEECRKRVTTKGLNPGETLSPQGKLQICLLMSPPFEGLEDDQIWDDHATNPRLSCKCRNRDLLVETLGDILYRYEVFHLVSGELQQETELEMRRATRSLKRAVNTFLLHKRDRIFFATPSLRYLQEKPVLEAFQIIMRLLEGLTATHYARVVRHTVPEVSYPQLLLWMHEAFADYGPKKKYPARAVHTAIAEILKHFNFEETPGYKVSPANIKQILLRERHK